MDKRLLSIAVGTLLAAGTAAGPVMAQSYDSGSPAADSAQPGAEPGSSMGTSGEMSSPDEAPQAAGSQGGADQQFSQVDKDGDKNVSKAEAEDAGLQVDSWSEADRDNDGVLDESEFSVFTEQQGSSGAGSSQQPGDAGGSMGQQPGSTGAQPGGMGDTQQPGGSRGQ